MKRKLPIISMVMAGLLGIIFMFYQTEKMEQKRTLEEKRQEVMAKLANNLSHFNPVLDAFVDNNYKTTIASEISSEGIVVYDRGLAKNKSPFGNYIVKYDLHNMEIVSEEIDVTNPDYSEVWREFQKRNDFVLTVSICPIKGPLIEAGIMYSVIEETGFSFNLSCNKIPLRKASKE